MRRRSISTRERVAIFERARGVCHICGGRIDGTREAWEVEHVVPLALGGDENPGSDNLQPAHVGCHARKTAEDAGRIAKAKRLHARHIGAKRPRSVIPGSRASRWKRTIDGRTVLRTDE